VDEQVRWSVVLVDVDETVLESLVRAATGEAADDVTPPLTPGGTWTPERVDWLRRLHRQCRAGLSGPERQATWAITLNGRVVGAVRLKRTADPGALETGIWLTRDERGHGVAAAAIAAVLDKAAELGAREVRADTTTGNAAALSLLRRSGFELSPAENGQDVQAVRRLHYAGMV
jgi:RimJ/RimL family protein N-acetyltransferase